MRKTWAQMGTNEITDRSVNDFDMQNSTNSIRTIHRLVYAIKVRSVNSSDMQNSIHSIRSFTNQSMEFTDRSMNSSDMQNSIHFIRTIHKPIYEIHRPICDGLCCSPKI